MGNDKWIMSYSIRMKVDRIFKWIRLLSCTMLMLWTIQTQAQNISLSGQVTDSVGVVLPSATVVTLNAADSLLIGFSFTDDDGYFKIKDHAPGDYILQLTYIGYQQFSQEITIENRDTDLGVIQLAKDANMIEDVVIKGEHTPIIIKKDTIEYNAAAFQTQPNDVVEDLLRKLPGVEIEDDGTIIAQGEEVKEVLVDGKEFFGKDPQMATKNIPADAIEKVQIFDKMSDRAEFTGIDDGEREKAINLEIKEGSKKGFFGTLSAGLGTDQRYEAGFNINRFTHSAQVSILGNFNNINKKRFNSSNYDSRMGRMGSGGRNTNTPSSGNGIVMTNAGGINVNYIPNGNTKIAANYFINDIETIIERSIRRDNFFDRGNFITTDKIDQLGSNLNHNLEVDIEQTIDTSQVINVRGSFRANNSLLDANNLSELLSADSILENTNSRINEAEGDDLSWSGILRYRKNLGSLGNSIFSTQLMYNSSADDLLGTLDSESTFDITPSGAVTMALLQERLESSNQKDISSITSYAYPLNDMHMIEATYQYKNYNTDNVQEVFDIQEEPALLEDLSSFYNRNYYYHRPGLGYHIDTEDTKFYANVDLQQSRLKGSVNAPDPTINRTFWNVLPKFNIRHSLSSSSYLSLNYSTSVKEPSISQLQPVADNTDPLRIYIGNLDLVPEYRHQVRFSFRKFDRFNFKSFFAYVTSNYTRNDIITQTFIDDAFVQTSQPINAAYNFSTTAGLSYGTPLSFLKSRLSTTLNSTFTRGYVSVNQSQNIVNRYINRLRISIENKNKDKIDISLGGQISYTSNSFESAGRNDQNFINQNYFSRLTLNLTNNIAIGSDVDYRVITQDDDIDITNKPFINAYLSYTFLKEDRGELKASVYDILNRNLGEDRVSGLNYVEYRNVASIGRYFMLQFTYALRTMGGRKESNNEGGNRRPRKMDGMR